VVRKIAYVVMAILILASVGVLPVSLVRGQAEGTPDATVTVTATPAAPAPERRSSTKVTSPAPLVIVGGVFTYRAVLYSMDSLVQLVFAEGVHGLTAEGEPISRLFADEVGGTYIGEMGDVYIVKMEDPPPSPIDAQIVGLVYDFGPDGATFDPPITITLTYDPSQLPDGVTEERLILAWWDDASAQWTPLEAFIVAPELNIIVAPISHFTPFSVLAYLRPVGFATFAASNLLVMPTEVDVGELVNIVISVANTGGQSGSYEVVLKINGLAEASREVTIAAGDSELVSFNIVKDTAGTYSLEVAGFTGSFIVKEEPSSSPPVDWAIIGGIIAAVVLAGVGLLYALRTQRR